MGDEGSNDPTPLKKARTGDLKRVAEIVMVLSAMGEMRGGKDPVAVEKALAAEARERLAGICVAEFKPKDLISREAVRAVVEDLGLNRSRDPMIGFRPAKMSIAEKLLLTKRKMEESKSFTSHSSAYSSQHSPGESHGTLMHGTPKFLPDRQSPMAFSAGSFQTISPGVHISTINASSLKQSHVSETHNAAASLKSSTSLVEKYSPMLAQPHAGASHLRFDGRFNGPPYLGHVQAASAEKTSSTSSVQSTSAVSVKPSQPNNLLDHTQGKSKGAHAANSVQTNDQVLGNQEAKIPEVHSAVANLPIGQQPAQGVLSVPGPSIFTTHEDISKSVQKILQPKVFDHPNWNPPSAEYTNKPINCQICKVTITDIENLLVCDACEKGTHLKCLQSYGNKDGVPKAEWHCPRCLVTSNEKPFPPKYGRVTRTTAPQEAPSNTVASSTSSDKRPENLASKVNQQKPVANDYSGLPHLVHASSSATNCSVLNLDSKISHAVDIQSGMKKKDELSPGTLTSNSTEHTGLACAAPHAEAENSDKDLKTSESLKCNTERSTFESSPDQKVESGQSCPENPQGTAVETVNQFEARSESKEVEVPISFEVFANQQEITSPTTDESKKPSKLQGESEHKIGCDVQSDDQDNCQAAPSGKPNIDASKEELKETSKCEANNNTLLDSEDKCEVTPNGDIDNDGSRDCGKPSAPYSDGVNWLGDILQVIDDKTYYQYFQINGVSHKLQNHVLISSSSQNFLPSKLQSLWEDNNTGTKWAVVNQYYFPSDLPEVVSCPSAPENNEVYASNKENIIMTSSICGSCEIMSMQKFKDEMDRRTHLRDTDSSLHPVFMCRWMYDESKGIFQSISD